MNDKSRIDNLKKAVQLLLPHAECWYDQLETARRTVSSLSQTADIKRRQIEQAKVLAEE